MIKRILCLLIVIMLMLVCVGCSNADNKEITDGRFKEIEDGYCDNGSSCSILVDTETNVMYLSYWKGITVMLDTDGKPLLWEGE